MDREKVIGLMILIIVIMSGVGIYYLMGYVMQVVLAIFGIHVTLNASVAVIVLINYIGLVFRRD